ELPVTVQTLLAELGPIENDDYASIRTEMLAAALPVRLVGEILADVEQHLLPFEPGASRRSLTRRALASRIKTANGWRTKQRTVAVVGLAGSGRTLTAASLATAYAAAGRTVAAHKLPTRIIVSHTDDQRPSGAAIGLALAHKIPVSFIGQSSRVGRLQPADPDALARMVLR